MVHCVTFFYPWYIMRHIEAVGGGHLNTIKSNLKRLRLAKSLSQEDLATQLNVVRQTVSSWETGKTEPDLDTLMAIAAALDVSVEDLLYGAKPLNAFCNERPQRKRKALLLLTFSVIVVLLSLFWKQLFLCVGLSDTVSVDFHTHSFRHLLYLFCSSVLPSCAYLLSAITFLSLLKVKWPIAVSSLFLRRSMLFIGTGTILAYFSLVIFVVVSKTTPLPLYYLYFWLYKRQFLFLFCGLFMELGSP